MTIVPAADQDGDPLMNRVIDDLARIDRLVRKHISALIDRQMGQWSEGGGDPSVEEVLIRYRETALSGGKRLRPAFTYWAFEGAGGDPDDPAILDAAVAVELLHTFALIHDDVMDQADTRRGVETIHNTYARRHANLGLRGDGTHYGESIAILMGDLAFAHAALLMTRVPAACAGIFFEMCADLMVGQYLDIETSARGPLADSAVAEQITELKTTRYTVEGPLLLGAAIADRSDDLRSHLHAYGSPLGHAFQLRDDLLGAFGDPAKTGKPVGDDLAQGKVTRLLELGLTHCGAQDRRLLERLGSADMKPDDVTRASDILVTCGARAEVESSIEQLVDQATTALAQAPLLPEIRDVLAGAAQLIAHRDH